MKILYRLFAVLVLLLSFSVQGQLRDSIPIISSIDLQKIPLKSIQKYWLHVGTDAFNIPITVPVLIAKGKESGPTLGLTAALHGNELNGVPIIQKVFKGLNVNNLKGTIIAIPGLNPISMFNDKRRFIDDVDLNRIFPGTKTGNRSQQMAYQIHEKIIKLLDFHIDMHTASFGRINSMYARADMSNDTLAFMAKLQQPDLILSNKGKASFGSSASLTMRAAAIQQGVHAITVEYGNPQVYQQEMIKRGTQGILNLIQWLQMIPSEVSPLEIVPICSKSYWIYTQQGGLLDVVVDLNEKVAKGALIATLKNPFGDTIEQYTAPENGIVIGKSTNPINMSGGRIIHLGILKKDAE